MALPRVMAFVGTRPEAIKMAPVIRELRAHDALETVVVSTGQHRDLLADVHALFGIRVDVGLSAMAEGQTLTDLTARLLTEVGRVLDEHAPSAILVQGDTTTVMAAAMAAFYRNIPVGHVEAGLRTGDLRSPFPEEFNRVIAGRVAQLHFAPTRAARANLIAEGVPAARVFVTGNTVIDALQLEVARQEDPEVRAEIVRALQPLLGFSIGDAPYVLITGHRRENFGGGIEELCAALIALATRFADHYFVYPVHPNPNVDQAVRERLGGFANIRLIPPQPYDRFVALMAGSRLVLTDSGGVQEEAPSLGKPVLVTRETTERPEAVAAGTARLVGCDRDRVVDEVARLLTDAAHYSEMASAVNPYGDGTAAGQIVRHLASHLASV